MQISAHSPLAFEASEEELSDRRVAAVRDVNVLDHRAEQQVQLRPPRRQAQARGVRCVAIKAKAA